MRSKEDILIKKDVGLLTELGTLRKDFAECMDEYAKETSIEYFKWHELKIMGDSKFFEMTLEERYNLFIKSLEEK